MSEATPEVQAKAREIGWRDQPEFKGNPDNWVDADEYLRRGEEVLPLVKAENRRLHEKTDSLETEIRRLTAVVAEQRDSMNGLIEFSQTQLKEKLAEQRRQLQRDLRAAKEGDDDAQIERLETALDENQEARQKLDKPAAAPPTQPQQVVEPPEYKAWQAANPWFGGTSASDIAKTAAAQAFGVQAAAAGKRGQAFFDAVDAKMAEVYPPQRRSDPTEDGRPSGGGGSTGDSKSGFNSLPAEAKAKAREQASKFVGANKMFKTEQAWFDYYAKQYNAEGV